MDVYECHILTNVMYLQTTSTSCEMQSFYSKFTSYKPSTIFKLLVNSFIRVILQNLIKIPIHFLNIP